MFADFLGLELQQILAGRAQHLHRSFSLDRSNVSCGAIADQYIWLICGERQLKSAAALACRAASDVRVARPVPWRAGRRGNRTVV
jgi:hypothetical protein